MQIKIADLQKLPCNFFEGKVEFVAKNLIGTFLVFGDGEQVGGRIVETEAYDENDLAAHCHTDADPRRFKYCNSMRLAGGHAYVYSSRINRPHNEKMQMWCLNFACGENGFGSAVLIRALEPIWGYKTMQERRVKGAKAAGCKAIDLERKDYHRFLCNGPAKLCEALGITIRCDGTSLFALPFNLYDRDTNPTIVCGPRVGVTKAKLCPRRYALASSIYISVSKLNRDLSADHCR